MGGRRSLALSSRRDCRTLSREGAGRTASVVLQSEARPSASSRGESLGGAAVCETAVSASPLRWTQSSSLGRIRCGGSGVSFTLSWMLNETTSWSTLV